MKTLLTLIAVLVLGCGDSLESENKRLEAELNEKREKLAAEEKNKKLKQELRRFEVVGTYECTNPNQEVFKIVIVENGKFQFWSNGVMAEDTWSIVGNEIHVNYTGDPESNSREVWKIEPNGGLTIIGKIQDGILDEAKKEDQITAKKIN